MSEFTDKDRDRAQKTLTLLEQHVKLSDERHRTYTTKLDDHEIRIRRNTTFRNWLAGGMFFGGGSLGAALSKILGGS